MTPGSLVHTLAEAGSAEKPGAMMRAFQDLNFRGPGMSNHAAHSDWLFFWIFAISTFFFVLLMVLMIYFSLKYRRRPTQAPERSRSHNTFLELSWSVIPTIILVWMFFEGFWGYADAVVPPAQAPELAVTARMWNWGLTYPNGAASQLTTRSRHMGTGKGDESLMSAQETPIYVVPEEFPVRLRMHSEDVIHSFWVPDFRVKFDVFPNRYTTLWFQASKMDPDKTETFQPSADPKKKEFAYAYEDHWVFCAEYCGQLHSDMYAVIRVVSQEDFKKLMALWAEPGGTDAEKGQAYYRIKGCNSCHSVDGSRNVGPTWKNMWGYPVELSDGSTVTVDANYVRESVLTPGAKIVKGYPNQMQSFQGQLGKDEEILNYLIAYMQSLSDRGPPPLPTGEPAAPAQGGPGAPVGNPGQQPPAGTEGKQLPPGPGGTPVAPGSPK